MTKPIRKQSPLWTLMSDVGFQLFAVLCTLVNESANEAAGLQQALVQEERESDGLYDEVQGLRGQLETVTTELAHFAETGAAQQGIIRELKKSVGEKGKQIGQLTTQLNLLRPSGPIDIVFIVDCSKSMQLHHERLRSAQKSLVRIVSRLSSDCRIGVLGIRNGVVFRSPLVRIQSPHVDDGESRDRLLDFMDGMSTSSSHVSHQEAIAVALEMLSDVRGPRRKQALLFLGDVGPSELDGQAGRTTNESVIAKEMLSAVRSWASRGDRSVGSIYVGKDLRSLDGEWFKELEPYRQ